VGESMPLPGKLAGLPLRRAPPGEVGQQKTNYAWSRRNQSQSQSQKWSIEGGRENGAGMSARQKKKTQARPTKGSSTKPCVPAIAALLLWFLFCGFGYVWCRLQVVSLGYSLSKAHRVQSQLLNDNKKLHLELARLRAPERLERIAIHKFGLNHPRKDQIVVLP
jgi:cell division protein FtsL